jgi:putative membrane protein
MATSDEIVEKVSEWKQKFGFAQTAEEQPIPPQERSLVKGMFAGLVGGLAATAAKSFAESLFPPRTHGEPEPPTLLAEKIAGHPLSETQKTIASESIHWGFGALTGAAYGGLAEYFPQATQKEGASFGLALASLTHGNALPALGLSASPKDQTTREHTSEMATHVVYGVVTEIVRSIVRKAL